MSVKAINQSLPAVQNRQQKQNKRQQSFTGSFNPVVTLMDFIDKGGFAASFIAQDGIGMVAPRIYEGLNRNREKDENGKYVFHTKGLANLVEDPIVDESQVYGVVVYKSIMLSLVYKIVSTNIGFYLFIIVPIFYIIGSEIISTLL